MARAAVKAKQQARAKAQPAKTARPSGRRRHAGGGNPNQQLFFMKLRRRQKWVFVLLAVVFGVTFVGVGVGSGSGGGLSQLYSGLFGSGSNPVSKAKGEIKGNPAKGYLDLARAYETKSDNPQAMSALQSYLNVKPKDASAWAELGGLELSQAQKYATQYQQAQQAAQLADPSQAFQPGGTLAGAVPANAVFSTASAQASTTTGQLYQQATSASSSAVSDYTRAAKLQPHSATAQQQLASAAANAGAYKVSITAWNRYLTLVPHSPQRAQIKQEIKQLRQALAASSATSSANGTSSTNGSTGTGGTTPAYGKK
jgi:hypothetical protein